MDSLTQCLLPVYDILAEESLCTKHKGTTPVSEGVCVCECVCV